MASVLLAYFKTPRIQIAALLYFLIAGALTQIPLFNYLGYEFSALMTIPTAFISGIVTLQFIREHRTKPLTRRTWLFVLGDYLTVNGLLLLIPLIIMSLNAFAIKNCAYVTGIAYFFLLPVCTMVFSVSLALVVGTMARRGFVLFVFFVTAILLHIVFITYTQPQLFAYNFILGFFPGITYDETLTDMTLLVIYRQFTLIASLMFIALSFILLKTIDRECSISKNLRSVRVNMKNDKTLWSVVFVCAFTLTAGHVYRDRIGFEYTSADIQQELGRRSESRHFIFYYSENDYRADDMRRVKANSELEYLKVAERLNIRDRADKKIEVFVYPNGTWKHRYIGTTTTNIAKPWKREIHLTVSTLASTFRHELVHILAGEFGLPVIHASTRMGLNEGLAVAVDWDEGMFSPHQYAAALEREEALEGMDQLFTLSGFAQRQGSFAYLTTGSFSRYLIDRFGIDRFRKVFPNGNFVRGFGESLGSLIADWRAFLRTVDDTEIPPATVKALFIQPSIFFKTCAREVAEQNQRAVRAIRVKDFRLAEDEFTASYANAPTAYALRGIFQSLNAQLRPKEVISHFGKLEAPSSLKTNPAVMLLLADAYVLDGQTETAREYYRTIRSLNFSESFIEVSALRLQCLADNMKSQTFHALFYSGMDDSLTSRLIESTIINGDRSLALRYYQALMTKGSKREKAALFLSLAPMLSSSDLKYFCHYRAAELLYDVNQFEDAKGALWHAKNFAPTGTLAAKLDEQIEACDYISMELQ